MSFSEIVVVFTFASVNQRFSAHLIRLVLFFDSSNSRKEIAILGLVSLQGDARDGLLLREISTLNILD